MKLNKLSYALVIAAASMASFNSYADGRAFEKMRTEMMQMNKASKDGMVSKEMFLDMAGKMFDMKAKEMGAKDMKMSEKQFKDFWNVFTADGQSAK